MSRPTYPFLPHCFYSDSCSLSTALSPARPRFGHAPQTDRQSTLGSSSLLLLIRITTEMEISKGSTFTYRLQTTITYCLCVKPPTWESRFKTLRLLPGLPSLCTVVRPTPRLLGRVFFHAFFAPLCFLATPRAPIIMEC